MKHDALDFLKKMTQIQSINPPGNERLVAIELQALLEEYGFETELIDFEEGRSNLVAWLRGSDTRSERQVLGFSGHMDVVPPGQVEWKYDPFGAVEDDGKLYGRGTSDMKGGLVALVFAMIALKEEGVKLNGDLKLLASAGEEMAAVGAKQLVASGHLNDVTALVVAEPTQDDVVVAHKGALWVEIVTYGKTAHGSMPHLGINAIVHMNHIMNALLTKFKMEYERDEILGEPTFNIAVIEGGVKTNVVPDKCSIQLDFRTVPSQRHEQILQQIEALLQSVKEDVPDLNTEIRVLNDLPSIRTEKSDEFVRTVEECTKQVYGEKKTVRGMAGYTDGAAFVSAGTGAPIVIIGGGDDRLAHQPDEYIEIDKFLQSIELYKAIAKSWLQ